MAFSAYARYCDKRITQLERSISKDDIERLRTVCRNLGETRWWAWCIAHHKSVLAYLDATPTARRNNKDWQADPDRLLLIFASIQYAMCGLSLLEHCEGILKSIGETPRDMMSLAVQSGTRMIYYPPRRWHFPGPDPFAPPAPDKPDEISPQAT
jgi:hypothetical protein